MFYNDYKGLRLDYWHDSIENRTDLSKVLVHLTKPYLEDLNTIRFSDESAMHEIHKKAVDRLIDILLSEELAGSGKDGFIIGEVPAVCFQETPFKNIIKNLNYEVLNIKVNNFKRIRYCGVGLYFSKFYLYSAGARPVIYEEKETAKKLLSYNEKEYWRIVNFKLNITEPFIENFFDLDRRKSHGLQTTIFDWTHEREWRMPNNLKFNVEDFLTGSYEFGLIFLNRNIYNYFIESIDRELEREEEIGSDTEQGIFNVDLRRIVPNSDMRFNIIILDEL